MTDRPLNISAAVPFTDTPKGVMPNDPVRVSGLDVLAGDASAQTRSRVTIGGIDIDVIETKAVLHDWIIVTTATAILAYQRKAVRESNSRIYRVEPGELTNENLADLLNMPPAQVIAMSSNQQQAVMQFDPYSGTHHPWPSLAEHYRDTWPHRTWYFDPWTGRHRSDEDFKKDPKGVAIQQP